MTDIAPNVLFVAGIVDKVVVGSVCMTGDVADLTCVVVGVGGCSVFEVGIVDDGVIAGVCVMDVGADVPGVVTGVCGPFCSVIQVFVAPQ